MITVVFEFPGVTAAQYEEVCRNANVTQDNVPDGLVFHSASSTGDGWLVVDVWQSEGQFAAFGERLAPALQQAGLVGQPKIYQTHAILEGRVPAGL